MTVVFLATEASPAGGAPTLVATGSGATARGGLTFADTFTVASTATACMADGGGEFRADTRPTCADAHETQPCRVSELTCRRLRQPRQDRRIPR